MPSWLVSIANNSIDMGGAVTYHLPIMGELWDVAPESLVQVLVRGDYTLSDLWVNCYLNSMAGDTVFTSRKNGAPGNQMVTVPAGATGHFHDAVNSDALADGDLAATRIALPDAHTVRAIVAYKLSSATGIPILCSNDTQFVGSGATVYCTIAGNDGAAAAEANARYPFRSAAVLSHLRVQYDNGASNAATVRLRKNGGNGNLLVSLPSGTSGAVEDAVNTDDIAPGDLVNYMASVPAGVGQLVLYLTHVKSASTGRQSVSSDNRHFYSYAFGQDWNTDGIEGFSSKGEFGNEGAHQVLALTPFTARNLCFNTQGNTLNGATTVHLRQNGANGNLSVSVPAGTTGIFEDTANSDDFLATDLVSWQVSTGGTAGAIYVDAIGFQLHQPAAAPATGTPGLSPGAKAAMLAGV